MIGSEGTLGFISRITYNTVIEDPFKASALVFFPDIRSACEAVIASSRNRFPPSNCSTARRCARSRTSRACRPSCANWAKKPPRC
jgi:FAD/FMN-containing dehydrogenase